MDTDHSKPDKDPLADQIDRMTNEGGPDPTVVVASSRLDRMRDRAHSFFDRIRRAMTKTDRAH